MPFFLFLPYYAGLDRRTVHEHVAPIHKPHDTHAHCFLLLLFFIAKVSNTFPSIMLLLYAETPEQTAMI